ncbi:MAG: AraC family transcriptional regulator [Ruminococcaceae bacterium]|nr:AraC family transcriptional regulator [Oscillospiraceae bacterium]
MLYNFEVRQSPFSATHITGLSPKPHIHPHLELIYIRSGSSRASVDGREHLLEQGDLILTFPNQIHFYNDISPVDGTMFIVLPQLFEDLRDLFSRCVPISPVIKHCQLSENAADQIQEIFRLANSSQQLESIAARGLFLALLAGVLQKMEMTPVESDHDTVKNILIYCMAHYLEPLNLETVSDHLHLSKYYISRIFQNRLHISFPEFINALRVDHACRLLTNCKSITDAAYASGFNSIRSFNRNFEQHIGLTPTQYIRKTKQKT